MFVNLIPSLTSGPVFVRNWGLEEGKFPPLRSLLYSFCLPPQPWSVRREPAERNREAAPALTSLIS